MRHLYETAATVLFAAVIATAGLVAEHASAGLATPADTMARPYGSYRWPVVGPVIRFFEAPETPYSAGHRGIDIAAPFGTPVHSTATGTVTFAGWVAGSLFVTVDHGDGIKTSYSFLSGFSVSTGQSVRAGQVIGFTGHGHPDVATPHLHFGARVNGAYVDPLLLLGGLSLVDLIRLAPLAA